MNESGKQPSNQSVNQSINQSLNQPINQQMHSIQPLNETQEDGFESVILRVQQSVGGPRWSLSLLLPPPFLPPPPPKV